MARGKSTGRRGVDGMNGFIGRADESDRVTE
jgi:hypothetical protein